MWSRSKQLSASGPRLVAGVALASVVMSASAAGAGASIPRHWPAAVVRAAAEARRAQARPPAAQIPCAKSVPAGTQDVTEVDVGHDATGWQLDTHYRNGAVSMTRCDASGAFAREQELWPVPVAGGGTALVKVDDTRPWRSRTGQLGRVSRSATLSHTPLSASAASAATHARGELRPLTHPGRRVRWPTAAHTSDTFPNFPGLRDACSQADRAVNVGWPQPAGGGMAHLNFVMVGDGAQTNDVQFAMAADWAASAYNHAYTDCAGVELSSGIDLFPPPFVSGDYNVQLISWDPPFVTTGRDNRSDLRWGATDQLCGFPTAIGCTLTLFTLGAGSHLIDADVYMLPDGTLNPGSGWSAPHTWGGLHSTNVCTPAQTVCDDFRGTLMHEMGHALGLQHVTASAQTMYPTATAGDQGRTLGIGDLVGLLQLYPDPFED